MVRRGRGGCRGVAVSCICQGDLAPIPTTDQSRAERRISCIPSREPNDRAIALSPRLHFIPLPSYPSSPTANSLSPTLLNDPHRPLNTQRRSPPRPSTTPLTQHHQHHSENTYDPRPQSIRQDAIQGNQGDGFPAPADVFDG